MCNLYSLYTRFLGFCKDFSQDLFDKYGNGKRPGPAPKFSDLELISLSLTADAIGMDSENHLFAFLKANLHDEIAQFVTRRRYNERKKNLISIIQTIRERIVQFLNKNEEIYCIDSMPVRICRKSRASRNKMKEEENCEQRATWGYCAAQKSHYFGFKLHATCSSQGVIHSFTLTPACVHDVKYLPEVKNNLPKGITLIGDKGYISASYKLDLFESCHIHLEVPSRSNMKFKCELSKEHSSMRKRIETIFSQLVDQFSMTRNYAKKFDGLLARSTSRIASMTMLQLSNYYRNTVLARIKSSIF